jgi:hypothetical protein
MKKIIFTVLLLFIYSVNLFAQTNLTKEEYAVYDTVLESRYLETLKQFSVKSSFVISAETVELDFIPTGLMNKKSLLDYSNEKFQSYPKDLLNDFKEKNQFSVKLEKQSPTEYEYYLVSKGELDKLLEEGKKEEVNVSKNCVVCSWGGFVWQPLRRKYPNSTGYSKFSRIGFSSDNKFALMFINSEAAGYGGSMFYILEKTDNKWKVKEHIWVTLWST